MPSPTAEDLLEIATAVGEHVEAQFAREFALIDQVNAAVMTEEVGAVTWES